MTTGQLRFPQNILDPLQATQRASRLELVASSNMMSRSGRLIPVPHIRLRTYKWSKGVDESTLALSLPRYDSLDLDTDLCIPGIHSSSIQVDSYAK